MQIKTIEVCGLYPAMKAIHLPMGKPAVSMREDDEDEVKRLGDRYELIASHADIIPFTDIELASRLMCSGDEHGKILRGVVVYVEITAPIYIWNEFVTYRIGAECLSSTSTMHIECRGLSGEALQKAKAEIPMGHEQTRILMISYQTLRRMYFQRRRHRLPEWHEICAWIEKLPFASKLITAEPTKRE